MKKQVCHSSSLLKCPGPLSLLQAPANMKSVLQGGWLLTVAFGNVIVLIVAEGAGLEQVCMTHEQLRNICHFLDLANGLLTHNLCQIKQVTVPSTLTSFFFLLNVLYYIIYILYIILVLHLKSKSELSVH